MKTAPLCLSALLALSATALPAVSAAAETPSAVTAPAETEVKELTADETWSPGTIAGDLQIKLNGHRLTLTGNLQLPNGKLTLSSTGEGGVIVLGEGGTISGNPAKEIEIASGTTVAVPPELLFTKVSSATPLLTVGDNARIEVTLPKDSTWHSKNTLQGKITPSDGKIPTAVLVKKGPGRLQFDSSSSGNPKISLKDLTLEVDGGLLVIGSNNTRKADPIFKNSCVRVTKNAPATSQWTNVSWWKLSGTNTFDIAEGISVEFDRTFAGADSAGAKLIKTGRGTFFSQIQAKISAEVREGTLHAEAFDEFKGPISVSGGATLELSPEPDSIWTHSAVVPKSCIVTLEPRAVYVAGKRYNTKESTTTVNTLGGPTLTAKDGAVLSLRNQPPTFSAFIREGTVCVLSDGKTAGATVLKRLDKDGTVTPEDAKNFIVRDADFIVEADTANKQYKLKKLTVTPPAGGASAAATPILSEKIRETAAQNGTAEVKVTGTSGTKDLSAADIEKVLTVFSGIETATAQDGTATLAVGYNFGIVHAASDGTSLRLTARIQKTDASAAALADGAKIRLLINGKTVEGVADKVKSDLKDGEVTFSVPMTAVPAGAKVTVEAVR